MDLTTPHFDGNTSLSTQGPYLGDQQINNQLWQPPRKGYVRISTPFKPGIVDGADPDNPNAVYYRIDPTTVKDLYMQFTLNLTDGHPTVRDGRGRRDQFYMTDYGSSSVAQLNGQPLMLNAYSLPDYNRADPATPTLFTSYWVEVAYFVKPNGKTTDGGLPLFDLYRRQKLLVEPAPPNPYPPQYSANSGNIDTSYWNNPNLRFPFNGSADVTEPLRRFGMNASIPYGVPLVNSAPPRRPPPFTTILDEVGITDPRAGGDLLMTNVLNFEIKATWDPVQIGAPNTDRFNTANTNACNFTSPNATNNPDYPFDYLPVGINLGLSAGATPARVFDTWSCNTDALSSGTVNYGPPITGPMNQQEYGAWNQGHFTPLPGTAGPGGLQHHAAADPSAGGANQAADLGPENVPDAAGDDRAGYVRDATVNRHRNPALAPKGRHNLAQGVSKPWVSDHAELPSPEGATRNSDYTTVVSPLRGWIIVLVELPRAYALG